MGFFNWKTEKTINQNGGIDYFISQFGSMNNDKVRFSNALAYDLSTFISEIFTPIDAIASRAASAKYNLTDLEGNEVNPTGNIKRILSEPNPFDNFSNLIYKLVFSGLSDGNKWLYARVPSIDKNTIIVPNSDNVKGLWALIPPKIHLNENSTTTNILSISSKEALIKYFTYDLSSEKLSPKHLFHESSSLNKRDDSIFVGISPLQSAERNINNLIVAYQARYNVYNNNGAAGYLSKKQNNSNNSIEQAIDPVTREKMLSELNEKNGITGNKNIIGLSSIPLEFVNTLASIKELMPFEETEADALAIAGIYGVDKDLLPSKDNSNYENKKNAELNLWQNIVKSECYDVADLISKALNLSSKNQKITPDFSSIECLRQDEKTKSETNKMKIENVKSIKDMGFDVPKDKIEEIINNL